MISTDRAKAIASLGLVGKVQDGFSVQSPGFAKETYRVWKDEAGRARCSCAEFTERVEQEPRFRCEHILAVKFSLDSHQPVETATATTLSYEQEPDTAFEVAPGFPRQPIAKTMADLVTPKQLVAIRVIANSQGINAELECRGVMNCKPEELSRKAASALIDHLKEQPDRRWEASTDPDDERGAAVLQKFTEAVMTKRHGNPATAERLLHEATMMWQGWEVNSR